MSGKRRVFLTGASSGIGLATARALVAADCEVWGTSRRLDRLPDDLAQFHPIALEMNSADSRAQACARVLAEARGLDVLINNAGDGRFGALADQADDDVRAQFETHVFGPLDLIRRLLPSLRLAPQGLVINVTSLAARLPMPYLSAYSGAKAAMSSLTSTLRMEECGVAASRVAFVDLQPGDIRTGFVEAMSGAPAGKLRAAWDAQAQHVAAAPPPELVATRIAGLVRAPGAPPAVVTVGDFFQARLAPLAQRILPTAWLERVIRRYNDL